MLRKPPALPGGSKSLTFTGVLQSFQVHTALSFAIPLKIVYHVKYENNHANRTTYTAFLASPMGFNHDDGDCGSFRRRLFKHKGRSFLGSGAQA
jgi:hypothetical protein